MWNECACLHKGKLFFVYHYILFTYYIFSYLDENSDHKCPINFNVFKFCDLISIFFLFLKTFLKL